MSESPTITVSDWLGELARLAQKSKASDDGGVTMREIRSRFGWSRDKAGDWVRQMVTDGHLLAYMGKRPDVAGRPSATVLYRPTGKG